MTDADAQEPAETVLDRLEAPTVYVDGIYGLQMRDGVVTMNLTQHVFPAPTSGTESTNTVVLRLVMPAPAFGRMAEWFQQTRDTLIEKGALIPVPPDAGNAG